MSDELKPVEQRISHRLLVYAEQRRPHALNQFTVEEIVREELSRAAVKEGGEDTKRLDWLNTELRWLRVWTGVTKGLHLRAAIDAAMSSPSVTQTETQDSPLATTPVAQGQQSKETEWAFDRYHDGNLMAQGARVHASTFEAALIKAKALFHEYPNDTFKLRLTVSPGEEDVRKQSPWIAIYEL